MGPTEDELGPDDVEDDGWFESGDVDGFDSDDVVLDEADDESSAHATPGVAAIAPPTPSATAKAPTRPMYLAYAVFAIGRVPALRPAESFAESEQGIALA